MGSVILVRQCSLLCSIWVCGVLPLSQKCVIVFTNFINISFYIKVLAVWLLCKLKSICVLIMTDVKSIFYHKIANTFLKCGLMKKLY